MSGVLAHWTADPFIVVAAATVLAHEFGLHHLARRSRPERTRSRRRHSFLFYGGLVVLVVAVASPVDYWAGQYFWVHMIGHLLIMFAAPMLIVWGAPWVPLLHALPVAPRRRLLRAVAMGRSSRVLRPVARVVASPAVAVVGFNATMVFWHLPFAYDLSERNEAVHILAMHASFFVFGLLFWLQFIGSHPFRVRLSPVHRIEALFSSNVVMFILALSMSFFDRTSWYTVYAHVPGASMSPLADQQLGAGILWVCGDFWCFPTLVRAVYEYIHLEDRSPLLVRPARRLVRPGVPQPGGLR